MDNLSLTIHGLHRLPLAAYSAAPMGLQGTSKGAPREPWPGPGWCDQHSVQPLVYSIPMFGLILALDCVGELVGLELGRGLANVQLALSMVRWSRSELRPDHHPSPNPTIITPMGRGLVH